MQASLRHGKLAGWVERAIFGARRGVELGTFYLMFAVFGLSSLAWSLPAGVLFRTLPRRWGAPLGQFMIMAGFRYFLWVMRACGVLRCDLSALDVLRHDRALIIAPNHPSLLDAVLIISRLPRVVCITKAKVWDNPFLGGGARLASYIRNDAPHLLVRRAAQEVSAGQQLLIFPEGTRTVCGPVNAFKGGFASMARKAGAPVQTVFIEVNSRFLGAGRPFFQRPQLPIVYRVRLGRRFDVVGDTRGFVAQLEDYYRSELGVPDKLSTTDWV